MPAIPKPVYVHRIVINDGIFNTSSILYYTITGASTFSQSEADNMGEAVAALLADPFASILSQAAAIKAHHGKLLAGSNEYEVSASGIFSGDLPSGVVEGDPLPTETVFEIQRRTGLTGRSNRGRIFVSGISELSQLKGGLKKEGDMWTNIPGLIDALGQDVTVGPIHLHPAHWDRKNNIMRTVTAWRGMDKLLSRRDRRRNLNPEPIG